MWVSAFAFGSGYPCYQTILAADIRYHSQKAFCFGGGYLCYLVNEGWGKEFLNRWVSAFVFGGGYPCY